MVRLLLVTKAACPPMGAGDEEKVALRKHDLVAYIL